MTYNLSSGRVQRLIIYSLRENRCDLSIVSPTLVNSSMLGSSAILTIEYPLVGVDVSLFMLRGSQSSLRRQAQRHKSPRSLALPCHTLRHHWLFLRWFSVFLACDTALPTLTLSSPPPGWFPCRLRPCWR